MIEKRFENRLNKSNVKFNILNPVWDNEKEDALNVFKMIDELNYLNDCCDNLIDDNTEYVAEINQMHKENEELKEELKFWKKQAKQCPMRSCKNSDTWYENNKRHLIDIFECSNFKEYD